MLAPNGDGFFIVKAVISRTNGSVRLAALSPDGQWVVTAGEARQAMIWEATTGRLVTTLTGHSAKLCSVAFSSNSFWVVTASWDNSAKVWERATGKPIHNAIVWQDTRTDRICHQLQAQGHAEHIYRKTGLPIATYFSSPKIRWLLDNVEGARARAHALQHLLDLLGHGAHPRPARRHRRHATQVLQPLGERARVPVNVSVEARERHMPLGEW